MFRKKCAFKRINRFVSSPAETETYKVSYNLLSRKNDAIRSKKRNTQ